MHSRQAGDPCCAPLPSLLKSPTSRANIMLIQIMERQPALCWAPDIYHLRGICRYLRYWYMQLLGNVHRVSELQYLPGKSGYYLERYPLTTDFWFDHVLKGFYLLLCSFFSSYPYPKSFSPIAATNALRLRTYIVYKALLPKLSTSTNSILPSYYPFHFNPFPLA